MVGVVRAQRASFDAMLLAPAGVGCAAGGGGWQFRTAWPEREGRGLEFRSSRQFRDYPLEPLPFALGSRPVAPDAVDLRWVAGTLSRNQTIEETGVAAGVLNHAGNGVRLLATRLAGHGDALAAGEVVLAGSFTGPMHVSAGDTVTAYYGPLGTVTCSFA